MARPKRQTVDYFPHFVKGGRTLYILENKFGNDGYAFWFKLLELLGDTDGHAYDCSETGNWEYLLAKTHVAEETAKEIMDTLVGLLKIDRELWEQHRIIWVQNFVNNLTQVYAKRHDEIPQKPVFPSQKPATDMVSAPETQTEDEFSAQEPSKGKESKEKESKVKQYPYEDIVRLWNDTCGATLPQVKKLNDNRRQKIKLRLNEFGKTPDVWRQTVTDLFNRVQQSSFLRGENNHNWTATFDWLFENPTNWVKVLEGNYDDNRGKQAVKQQRQQAGVKLGVGEYITDTGRRTYGTGKATIPMSAPPRPSERYSWNADSEDWIMQ